MNIQNILNKGSIILCIIVLSAISIAGCSRESRLDEILRIQEQAPPTHYDIKCYSNGNGLIYEGTANGRPSGNTRYGFHWRDTEGRDIKVAGDCVFIRLDNE